MSAYPAVSSTDLPAAAVRALRAAAALDHARSVALRRRSGDHNSRANKYRAVRLRMRSLRAECRAVELAGEVRA